VEAGLQTAGWLSGGIDSELAAAAAAKRDVEVTPLSRYSRRRMAREGLQLGFAAVDAKEIQRGVRELAIALEKNYVSFIAELASVLSDCVHSKLQTRSRIEIPVKVTSGAK